MLRILIIVVLLLAAGASPQEARMKPATAKTVNGAAKSVNHVAAAEYQPSPSFDEQAELQLLEMANQSRAKAGAPPLQRDEGLMLAARAHAEEMARQQQLSHQFDGEPSLPRRLSMASPLHLDHAGENVALDATADQAHRHLMLSPPHRENLLDASYNVVGFGVIRRGDQLYVVQDFGHSLPAMTTEQTENAVASAVLRARRGAHMPALTRQANVELSRAVCSMAQQDRLGTRSMHHLAQRYSVLSYTNMHPEVLPASANRLIADRNLKSLAVGVCYARTDTYPGGVYWVGLLFY